MSKLNDSTLKIFKKYRLDTDMSVFGNENKLYDVVKVMDDMVGNQVSGKAGTAIFLNSSGSSTEYRVRPNNNIATYTPYQKSGTQFTTTATKQLCFDALTFKYLYNNIGGQYALVSKVHKVNRSEKCSDNNFLCYLFYDKENNLFKLFYDLSTEHECTDIDIITGSKYYAFTPIVCFSDEPVSAFAVSPWSIFKSLFPDATFDSSQQAEQGSTTTDTILLPSLVNFSPYYISSNTNVFTVNLTTNSKRFFVEL